MSKGYCLVSIETGAEVMQDCRYFNWTLPETKFLAEKCQGYFVCRRHGYGEFDCDKGYGNGAVSVRTDQIILLSPICLKGVLEMPH